MVTRAAGRAMTLKWGEWRSCRWHSRAGKWREDKFFIILPVPQQLHLVSPSSGFLRPVVNFFQAEREAMAV
jgi:hypothetical protein